jgi:hypothetical protein
VKTIANPAKPLYSTENILTFSPTGAIGANSVNHNFGIEYNEGWNATPQKQLAGNTFIEASYIESRTVHADSSTVLNVPSTFWGSRPVPQLAAFSTIRWDGWATFRSPRYRPAIDPRWNYGAAGRMFWLCGADGRTRRSRTAGWGGVIWVGSEN